MPCLRLSQAAEAVSFRRESRADGHKSAAITPAGRWRPAQAVVAEDRTVSQNRILTDFCSLSHMFRRGGMNPDDILLWPDGFWCLREELNPEFMRDDEYRVLPASSNEAKRILTARQTLPYTPD
jgi:hypothetical protein